MRSISARPYDRLEGDERVALLTDQPGGPCGQDDACKRKNEADAIHRLHAL